MKTSDQLDCSQKFVRVSGIRNNQFVEFDFAIGDPELFVEMILPIPAFKEFCEQNQVILLEPEAGDVQVEFEKLQWRLGKVTPKGKN